MCEQTPGATTDPQDTVDDHVRNCEACTHWCGWCDPLTCAYGPVPLTTDLRAHIADVGEADAEPGCYGSTYQPVPEGDR